MVGDEYGVDLPLPSLAYAQYLAPLKAREPEGQAQDLEDMAAMEVYLNPPLEDYLGTKLDLLA